MEPPLWCRQPYRPLFALGLLLAWMGVAHWLLFAFGWLEDSNPRAHALTQVQGFLSAFAAGFLLTMIPRRTGTAPPSALQLALCLAAPAVAAIGEWLRLPVLAQLAWILLLATLASFAVTRFLAPGARRRPPNAFVWIPLSLLAALAGAGTMTVMAAALPSAPAFRMAWSCVTQGLFLGLVFGVGSMLLPLVTRKDSSTDAGSTPRDRRERILHVLAFLVLLASFVWEAYAPGTGPYALRAALCLAVLVSVPRLHRPPTVPGLHRRLVWLAGWMLPAGYALAAVFPDAPQAGLHVVFIGGFGTMTLAVGMHVGLAHGGAEERVFQSPWPVWVFGILLLAATLLRAMAEIAPPQYLWLVAAAAASFLLGTLAWAAHVLPALLAPRSGVEAP